MAAPGQGTMICEELLRILENQDTGRLRILLHAGVPVNLPLNESRATMLHLAVRKGDEITCLLLLSFGADPDVRDESRETPLEIAQRLGMGHILHLFEAEDERRKEAAGLRPGGEEDD